MRIKYLRGFWVFELGYPELPGKGVALVLDPKGSFLPLPAPGDRKEELELRCSGNRSFEKRREENGREKKDKGTGREGGRRGNIADGPCTEQMVPSQRLRRERSPEGHDSIKNWGEKMRHPPPVYKHRSSVNNMNSSVNRWQGERLTESEQAPRG
jgi:hypothetical protein